MRCILPAPNDVSGLFEGKNALDDQKSKHLLKDSRMPLPIRP
jgi:hypothetical protein